MERAQCDYCDMSDVDPQIADCGGMPLEEQPGKTCEAFRLFLQGMGYGESMLIMFVFLNRLLKWVSNTFFLLKHSFPSKIIEGPYLLTQFLLQHIFSMELEFLFSHVLDI